MTTAPPERPHVPVGAHLALLTAQLGFGLFPIVGKLVFHPEQGDGVPPLGVGALRAAFGAASLFALAEAAGAPRVASRRDLALLAIHALFGIVLNQTLYLEGLSRSSATHAGVLVAATPTVAYALALLLRRERASGPGTLGVALAGAGAAWIVLERDPAHASAATLLGDGLILLNVHCYAVYLVLVRDVLQRVDPLRAIAWVFVFGAVANVPLGAPALAQVAWATLTWKTWAGLAFVLLFPTSISYALNILALRRAPATVAAVYTCTQPVIATTAAALVLGERAPLLETACAGALILLGVGLVAFRRAPSPRVSSGPG